MAQELVIVVRRARRALALVVATASLAGCSWFDSSQDETFTEQPVEVLYNRALDDLGRQEYKLAAKEFEEVDRQHPYSVWATKAQIMAAFTYYQSNKYDDAIIALDRFIQLHPGHRDIPYAYYLKGLCYYEQISDVGRDQRMTQQALDALSEVAKRFPDSPYARDARLKLELTIDHLAGKEMDIGRYYMERRDFTGAINRFKMVVTQYQRTRHVEEALARLTEAYMAIGIVSEAQTAAALLGHNFPESNWYKDAYSLVKSQGLEPSENKSSWMSRALRKVGLG
jgi:outer membrane protein assembly factor BamD